MDQKSFERLKKICETPGTSGFEHPIRTHILEEVRPLVDETLVDSMGNIIAKVTAKKKPTNSPSKRVMACAHMDEIGFVVSHIEKGGFLRLYPLGGFDVKTLCAQRVLIYGKEPILGAIGTKPVHILKDEERRKVPELEELYVDTGLSEEQVRQTVSVGDPVARFQSTIRLGNLVCAKSLDNRISVFALIETLRRLPALEVDFYAVFSTQEEVGIRGARVAAAQVQPDIGIALDVTLANDVVGISEKDYCTRLGAGVGIKVMDGSTVACKELVDYFVETAKRNKITYQMELLVRGGSDTSGLQYLAGKGALCGCLSIPCRNVHSSCEAVHGDDVEASINLLIAALESLDRFQANHITNTRDWSAIGCC